MEKSALREVFKIGQKIEGEQPRPSNGLLQIEREIATMQKTSGKAVKVRVAVPPRQESQWSAKTEQQQLKKEVSLLDRWLVRDTALPPVSKQRSDVVPQATPELRDVERKLADVDTISRQKGYVRETIPSRGQISKERDEQRLALEQQMVENLLADDQQKRALWKMRSKPSKELIAVEEELAQVERRQDRSAKVMSVLPVVTESSHRTAVEELRRVSAEYRQIDGMLKNNLSGSLKREKKIIPHPELLEVEQKLNRLETMFPVKAGIKIKTTPSPVPQSEAPAERKEVINRELETVTKALAAGERKPGSLLSKLFPHRKTREEKKADKEAFREVLKISAKIERGSSRPSNELVEIERKLAVVDKVPWKPVKIRETIPPPNRMETERNQPHIVQEKKEMGEVLDRGKKRREQKPSKELVDLEQKLAKLKKEMR